MSDVADVNKTAQELLDLSSPEETHEGSKAVALAPSYLPFCLTLGIPCEVCGNRRLRRPGSRNCGTAGKPPGPIRFHSPCTSVWQQSPRVGPGGPGQTFLRPFPEMSCPFLPLCLGVLLLLLVLVTRNPVFSVLRIKNHLQKATQETIFKLTLIFFFFLLPKYCTCRSHVKNFLLEGIGKNVVGNSRQSSPAVHLPPRSHSKFGKMLHIENVESADIKG